MISGNCKSSGEPFLSGYHLLLHGLRVKYCILHVKQINDDDDEIL